MCKAQAQLESAQVQLSLSRDLYGSAWLKKLEPIFAVVQFIADSALLIRAELELCPGSARASSCRTLTTSKPFIL
uniref:Uncharacterized protein n=1 Tax=Rhizophagus irregularis (strain DAOM 181602 / DAOM 197198 / MUCL 43194) TaxID=747089 RepID=U9U0E4_RHIID